MDKKVKHSIQFKNGVFYFALTLIIVAVVIVINLIVNALPASKTTFSISETDYYSINNTTKDFLKNVNNSVKIHLLSGEDGSYEDYLDNITGVISSYNKKIEIDKVDVVTNPGFVLDYKIPDNASTNSVVVENVDNGKYRVIPYSQLVYSLERYDENGSSYSSWNYDGEGQIVSAINYVINDSFVNVYQLTGHKEMNIKSTTLSVTLAKSNYTLANDLLDLTQVDAVPDDCNVLFITSPQEDISEIELSKLKSYCDKGGNLIIIYNKVGEDGTPNLYDLIKYNNLELVDGLIIEKDTDHYYSLTKFPQFTLLPTINEENNITGNMTKETALCFYSSPVKAVKEPNGSVIYDELLLTSNNYQIKHFLDQFTVDYTEPSSIATMATTTLPNGNISKTLVIGCFYYLQNVATDSSILATNEKIINNTIKEMVGDDTGFSIEAKCLDEVYNSPSKKQSSLLVIIYAGLIPVLFLVLGICNFLYRQSKN